MGKRKVWVLRGSLKMSTGLACERGTIVFRGGTSGQNYNLWVVGRKTTPLQCPAETSSNELLTYCDRDVMAGQGEQRVGA